MDYGVFGVRPSSGPKITWMEIVDGDLIGRHLVREDAMLLCGKGELLKSDHTGSCSSRSGNGWLAF